jgi:uncharacterized iron-regulated membrane protein
MSPFKGLFKGANKCFANLVVIDALSVGAWIGILCGAVVLSAVATFFIVKLILGSKTKNADHNAQQILRDAQIKAERITKNAEIDAKQAAFEARQKPITTSGLAKANSPAKNRS